MDNENNNKRDLADYFMILEYGIPAFIILVLPILTNLLYTLKYILISLPVAFIFVFKLYYTKKLGRYQLPSEEVVKKLKANRYIMAITSRKQAINTIMNYAAIIYIFVLTIYDSNFILIAFPFLVFTENKSNVRSPWE